MVRRKRHLPIAEINVVPYIDVMLVLLIIFMVTAPLLVRNVDVDLPISQGDPDKVAEKQPPIVVGIDQQGRYFLYDDESGSRNPVANEQDAVAEAIALGVTEPERELMVYGDKKVEYGVVLRLLQSLQATLLDQGVKNKPVKLMTIVGEES
jgi:biopolymer transport protein TolR